MDVDFLIQETFALTRPQWKIAASLDEAGAQFAESVKQNYRLQEQERAVEAEPAEEEFSSDDDADEEDLPVPDMDDHQSSGDEEGADNDYPEVCGSHLHCDCLTMMVYTEWSSEP